MADGAQLATILRPAAPARPAVGWFLARVVPQGEATVRTLAEMRGITVYYACGSRLERRGRTMARVKRPTFAGYVFVAFPPGAERFDLIDSIEAARDWIMADGRPAQVPGEVIDELREREARGEFDECVQLGRFYLPRWVRIRARVEIAHGVFVGFRGRILRVINRATVRIRFDRRAAKAKLLGEVDIPLEWLRKVEQ